MSTTSLAATEVEVSQQGNEHWGAASVAGEVGAAGSGSRLTTGRVGRVIIGLGSGGGVGRATVVGWRGVDGGCDFDSNLQMSVDMVRKQKQKALVIKSCISLGKVSQ